MQRDAFTDADDRRLLAAIAAGDQEAFASFYRRYSSTVYALSLRITGQDHDAQDVVADVFWELWDKSARYSPSKASPYTYLIMLTRCRALDRKRGLSRSRAHGILDWASDEDAGVGADSVPPPDHSAAVEARELVAEAVAGLDPNLRKAIELTFFDGLTHKATAEKLGLPLGTVKGRVRSALEKLRKVLAACKSD
jgi:RNA polymerase sigma-70 factor (ECF subfamily)